MLITNKKRRFLLGLVTILFLVILSCAKDTDIFYDAVLEDEEEVSETEEVEESSEEEEETDANEDETAEDTEEEVEEEIIYETRSTVFPPLHDAHLQEGQAFDQSILRVENQIRTSYLLYDLSQIDSIGGKIKEVKFKFTVEADEGDGKLGIYKGSNTSWTEANLEVNTAPDKDVELGFLQQEFPLGSTPELILTASEIENGLTTLILEHAEGDDFAIASKEHPSIEGANLFIVYDVPEGAPTIEIEFDEENDDESQDEDSTNSNPPTAVADASPLSGEAPLEVAFSSDQSTDEMGISRYSWNFKDGNFSEEPNPTHTFLSAGEYEVKLTIENEDGLEATDTVTISVEGDPNEKPTARISASVTSGLIPLEVNFQGEDSSDDKSIIKYEWDFKDGGKSTVVNPSHIFETAGEFNVSLTVTDQEGLTDTKTILITTESPNEAPTAKATATPTSGDAPLSVSFRGANSTDDKEVVSYEWDFGFGNPSTNKNPSRTFQQPGEYVVVLTVSDEEGLTDTDTVTITVSEATQNEAPVAIAEANITEGEAPLTVSFSAENSNDDNEIVAYNWDFGFGNPSTNKNPSRTFQNPGTYDVVLTVTDDDGVTATDTITITVNDETSGGGSSGNYPPDALFASTLGFNANDASEAFEAAIKSNNDFIVIDKQSSDWIIQPTRFFNVENKTIVFEEGVVLQAKAGAFTGSTDVLFNFTNGKNLTILGYGATLQMNKSEYTSGEFRHALKLGGCTNVTVKGFTIRDSGGDGININRGTTKEYSENIIIEDVVSLNNRRQGLSVVTAKDVWIRNSEFSETKGTQPEAGIDLEPTFAYDRLQNINIQNCTFRNNNFAGIMIAPDKMDSSSIPIDIVIKDSQFQDNAKSTTHPRPRTEIRIGSNTTGQNVVNGNVLFENITILSSRGRILNSQKPANSFDVTFRNLVGNNLLKQYNEPVIEITGKESANSLGGFYFENCHFQYNGSESFLRLRLPVGPILKDIVGDFTIDAPTVANPIDYNSRANPANGVNVSIQYDYNN